MKSINKFRPPCFVAELYFDMAEANIDTAYLTYFNLLFKFPNFIIIIIQMNSTILI